MKILFLIVFGLLLLPTDCYNAPAERFIIIRNVPADRFIINQIVTTRKFKLLSKKTNTGL